MKQKISRSLFFLAVMAFLPVSAQAQGMIAAQNTSLVSAREGEITHVGFEAVEDEVVTGSITVIASVDDALDHTDQVVGTATFDNSGYAQADFALDDRLLNKGGIMHYTLFYQASNGLILNRLIDTLTVQDDDVLKQPVFSSVSLHGRTLTAYVTFFEKNSSGTLTLTRNKQIVGKVNVAVKNQRTKKVVVRVSKKTADKLRRGASLEFEFSGTAPSSDLQWRSVYSLN
jgi:hypothetical protein